MKIKTVLFSMILGLGLMSVAQAEQNSLVNLTAEEEPGKISTLGIMTDKNNNIESFYFHPQGSKILEFSPQELTGYKTLVNKKGYKLVQVKSTYSSDKSLKIVVKYIKSIVYGDTGVRTLLIKFNRNINDYQILDEEGRPFTKAHIVTHHNLIGVATGIEEIRTQQ